MKDNMLLVGMYQHAAAGFPGTDSVAIDVAYFSGSEWRGPGPEEAKRLLIAKYGTDNPAEIWPCVVLKEVNQWTNALMLPV